MALQKVNRNLLNTGVSDSSDATAITINSSEQVGIGETSPLGKLHAKVSDTVGIGRFGTSTTCECDLRGEPTIAILRT